MISALQGDQTSKLWNCGRFFIIKFRSLFKCIVGRFGAKMKNQFIDFLPNDKISVLTYFAPFSCADAVAGRGCRYLRYRRERENALSSPFPAKFNLNLPISSGRRPIFLTSLLKSFPFFPSKVYYTTASARPIILQAILSCK